MMTESHIGVVPLRADVFSEEKTDRSWVNIVDFKTLNFHVFRSNIVMFCNSNNTFAFKYIGIKLY